MPKLSIILAAHDHDRLQLALDSLYAQTFRDFELILVDDAATDAARDMLRAACKIWRPTRLLVNSYNIGTAGSWNRGMLAAKGEYVALQNPYAISLPARLQRQVEFLDQNPLIDLVGTNAVQLVGKNDEEIGFAATVPSDTLSMHAWIRNQYSCPVIASSITCRRDVVLGYGGFSPDTEYPVFDLICRLLSFNCNAANLSEPLVKCRIPYVDPKKSREIAAKFRRRNLGVPKLSASEFSGPTFSEWENPNE